MRSDLAIAPEADDDALLDAVARLPKYEAVRAFLDREIPGHFAAAEYARGAFAH